MTKYVENQELPTYKTNKNLSTSHKIKSECTVRFSIFRLIPILTWIRSYTLHDVLSDVVAGFTIGLMLTPQSLAYGDLAGLPAQYGLYSAIFGVMLYAFLGTSKDIAIGPTAVCSALIHSYAHIPETWPIPSSGNTMRY